MRTVLRFLAFIPVMISLTFGSGTLTAKAQPDSCEDAKRLVEEGIKQASANDRADIFRKAVVLCPRADEPHFRLGAALEEQADEQEAPHQDYLPAKQEYARALEINPQHLGALFRSGALEYVSGDFDKAAVHFQAYCDSAVPGDERASPMNDTAWRLLVKSRWLRLLPANAVTGSTLRRDPDIRSGLAQLAGHIGMEVGRAAMEVTGKVGYGAAGLAVELAGSLLNNDARFARQIKRLNNAIATNKCPEMFKGSVSLLPSVIKEKGIESDDTLILLKTACLANFNCETDWGHCQDWAPFCEATGEAAAMSRGTSWLPGLLANAGCETRANGKRGLAYYRRAAAVARTGATETRWVAFSALNAEAEGLRASDVNSDILPLILDCRDNVRDLGSHSAAIDKDCAETLARWDITRPRMFQVSVHSYLRLMSNIRQSAQVADPLVLDGFIRKVGASLAEDLGEKRTALRVLPEKEESPEVVNEWIKARSLPREYVNDVPRRRAFLIAALGDSRLAAEKYLGLASGGSADWGFWLYLAAATEYSRQKAYPDMQRSLAAAKSSTENDRTRESALHMIEVLMKEGVPEEKELTALVSEWSGASTKKEQPYGALRSALLSSAYSLGNNSTLVALLPRLRQVSAGSDTDELALLEARARARAGDLKGALNLLSSIHTGADFSSFSPPGSVEQQLGYTVERLRCTFLYFMGNFDSCLRCRERVHKWLEPAEKYLPENLAIARERLGESLAAMGKVSEAKAMLEKAKAVLVGIESKAMDEEVNRAKAALSALAQGKKIIAPPLEQVLR